MRQFSTTVATMGVFGKTPKEVLWHVSKALDGSNAELDSGSTENWTDKNGGASFYLPETVTPAKARKFFIGEGFRGITKVAKSGPFKLDKLFFRGMLGDTNGPHWVVSVFEHHTQRRTDDKPVYGVTLRWYLD